MTEAEQSAGVAPDAFEVALAAAIERLPGEYREQLATVAIVIAEEDSFESHVQDTLNAGAGLCRPDVVRAIVRAVARAGLPEHLVASMRHVVSALNLGIIAHPSPRSQSASKNCKPNRMFGMCGRWLLFKRRKHTQVLSHPPIRSARRSQLPWM